MGDLRRAAALVAQAKRMAVRYAPTDDTPERVEAALARYQEVNSLDKGTQAYRRAYARMLMEQAEALLRWGDYEQADQLAAQAARQQVDYGPFDARPEDLLRRIAGLRQQGAGPARMPSGVMPAVAVAGPGPDPVAPAYYVPAQDMTRNIQVSGPPSAAETIATPPGQPLSAQQPVPSQGYILFQQGEAALKAHDRDRAYQLFRQASAYMNELDPLTAQRLQDHLQLLSMPRPAARGVPPGQPGSPAEEAAARQLALQRQVYADVGQQEANARALLEKDPKGALALLRETRQRVEAAGLQPAVRDQVLRRLDRAIVDTQQFIEQNRPRIELTERNEHVKADIKREELAKEQMRAKVALKVDEYNRLIDEHRYDEAVVVAKQAGEIAPDDPTVKQLLVTDAADPQFEDLRSHQGAEGGGLRQGHERGRRRVRAVLRRSPALPGREEMEGIDPPAKAGPRTSARHGAGDRDREEAQNAHRLLLPQQAAEPGPGPTGQAGQHQHQAGRGGAAAGGRVAGYARVAGNRPGNHAQERAEPDPRRAAPVLRDQG